MHARASPLAPDWLELRSGEKLQGEIVRADRSSVDFRMQEGGKWVTKTFNETDIVRRQREDGDQSDRATKPPAAPTGKPPINTASTPAPAAGRDKIILLDGKTLVGVVLRFVPGNDLEFHETTSAPGNAETQRIPLDKISQICISPRKPNGQNGAAGVGAVNNHAVALDSPKDLIPLLRNTVPPAPAGGEVIVIKLDGEFKGDSLFGIGSTITPGSFDALMTVAKERHPAAIVLAINSGGGFVWVMKELIEELLDLQRQKGMRIVAWPSSAGSAAAIMALACKEIVVTPTTRMGSAIAIQRNGEAAPTPKNALEQKLQAWDDALLQLVIEFTGRSSLVQKAMQDAKLEVWFHQKERAFQDTQPTNTQEWVPLDANQNLPLVLTGDQLRLIHFALPEPATKDQELLKALGFPEQTVVQHLDLNHPDIQAAVAPFRERTLKEFGEYQIAWNRIWDQLSTFRSAVQAARNCRTAFPEGGIAKKHLDELKKSVKKAQDSIPTMKPHEKELLKKYAGDDWVSDFDFWNKRSKEQLNNIQSTLVVLLRNQDGMVSEFPEIERADVFMLKAYGIGKGTEQATTE